MRFFATALCFVSIAVALPSKTQDAGPYGKFPGDHLSKGQESELSKRTTSEEINTFNLRCTKNDPSELGVDNVKQFSGYLHDETHDKHLFYWFFESRNDPANDPVILWLNGGPGSSSLTGLFAELGPSRIVMLPSGSPGPERRGTSWNRNANIIFIDQPVHAGFSYSNEHVVTSPPAAKDIHVLLTLFFRDFPQYSKQDFHIAGESYAGHTIPTIAHEILSQKDSNINLKSLLIGNGITDAYTQFASYEPMACGNGGYDAVLDDMTCTAMRDALPHCQETIKSCHDKNQGCLDAWDACVTPIWVPYKQKGGNIHDVRIGEKNSLPEEKKHIESWLNQDDVKQALGVDDKVYASGNADIYKNFQKSGDLFMPIHKLLPDILDKIPILVYAGDADFIGNWLGNQAWTNALQWSGQDAFKTAATTDLQIGTNEPYGKIKHAKGLAFLRVYKTGHMVPRNQPEGALDFVHRWVRGEWQN